MPTDSISSRPCAHCRTNFEPSRPHQRYCGSALCKRAQMAALARASRARRKLMGLPSQPQIDTECAWCSKQITVTSNKKHHFCSMQHSANFYSKNKSCEVPWSHPSRSTPVPKDHPCRLPAPKRRVFVAGTCIQCGKGFIALQKTSMQYKYCSRKCIRYSGKAQHRARKKEAFIEPVYRQTVFARDNFLCRLCGDPMDMSSSPPNPMAPTIDHIIPLANGGMHEMSNCQSAHFICNSRKGNRIVT